MVRGWLDDELNFGAGGVSFDPPLGYWSIDNANGFANGGEKGVSAVRAHKPDWLRSMYGESCVFYWISFDCF